MTLDKEEIPIIQIRDLWFNYPDGTLALKGIDLDIYDGEFIGVIGQNGSGKTTLVKHFNALLLATNGHVLVNNINVRTKTSGYIATIVGYVFQNPDYQLFSKSVEEEVKSGPKNLGLPENEINNRVDYAINLVDLEDYRDAYPFGLPVGVKQRVAIATVMAMKPDIICVDEPTTGQDQRQARIILDMMKKFNKEEGKTIVIITHDMRLVTKYTDRVVVLADGRIFMDGKTEDVFSHPDILLKTLVVPPQITQLAQRLTDLGIPKGVRTEEEMVSILIKNMKG